MDRLEQVFELQKLLHGRRTVLPRTELETRLGVSRSTATRLIEFCRSRLNMPIKYDYAREGYCYDEGEGAHQLPGLWFNASELNALLLSQHLLAKVQPGLLEPWLAPVRQRIEQLLQHEPSGGKSLLERVRILPIANRQPRLEEFLRVGAALAGGRKLRLVYSARSNGEISERWVSPQRLVYYRDNWYLDGWCHMRKALRTFSIDHLQILDEEPEALAIDDEQLDAHFTRSYGIFSGPASTRAVLHFSGDAARWVAEEEWHPDQQSRHLGDGRWELVVPYDNPTELIRDILKFGPDVEVIGPPELRQQVVDRLGRAMLVYQGAGEAEG